jgi:hypothetical protein
MSGGGWNREVPFWPKLGMAPFAVSNADYAKMAADSISKEVEERGLIAPTPQAAAGENSDRVESATTAPPADNSPDGSGSDRP